MAVYILLTCSVIVAAEGGGLTTTERDQIAIVAQSRPSIDLEVSFDYRSAGITRVARQQLESLGMALISPELNGITVLIAGHTSPEGPERYNVMLAQRRSEVIKRFLVENFDIPPEHLITVGYGSRRLKNAEDPFASENRRVQIINMSDK